MNRCKGMLLSTAWALFVLPIVLVLWAFRHAAWSAADAINEATRVACWWLAIGPIARWSQLPDFHNLWLAITGRHPSYRKP